MPKQRAPKARPQKAAKPKEALVSESSVQDIIGVLLVVCAVAMTVAIVSPTQAPVTSACAEALELCFGVGAFLIPLAIALLAFTFFIPTNAPLSSRTALGLFLVVLAVLALVSLAIPGAGEDPLSVVRESQAKLAGGWVGGAVAWLLLVSVGHDVGLVVLLGIIALGLIVCGFSVSGLAVKIRQAKNSARERRVERNREAQGDTLRRDEEPVGIPSGRTKALTNESGNETTFIGVRKTSVLHRREPRPKPTPRRGGATPLVSQPLALHSIPTRSWVDASESNLESFEAATPVAPLEPVSAPPIDGTAALRLVDAPDDVPREGETYAPRLSWRQSESGQKVQHPTDQQQEQDVVAIPSFLLHFGEVSADSSEAPNAPVTLEAPSPQTPKRRSRRPKARRSSGAASTQKAGLNEDSSGVFEPSRDSFDPSLSEGSNAAFAPPALDQSSSEELGLPPLSMLESDPQSGHASADDSELTATADRLQSTLEEFGLRSRVVGWVSGPLVTTFKIEMGEGERVNRITNLEDDIALTLAAESVRIFAPIPGTSHVGIEIPNRQRRNVHLGDVLPHAQGGPLELAIGRDSEGKPVVEDLATMPHLLIAGATGSGKSVMINSIIMSLLMRTTPSELRLILIDPKRVELGGYNGLPHLYVPVVTEPKKASGALSWAVGEMDRRLKLFEKAGARDIGVYNRLCEQARQAGEEDAPEPIPYLVIIVDELSDLMMVAGKDVEASIVRIAQLARAAGIHLIVATQRPSANVVTGLIKSNIENRIAFSVASGIDSRVILDQVGAERLLGRGDMLLRRSGKRTRRVLGAFVSDEEINSVVDFIKERGTTDYHEEVLLSQPAASDGASQGGDDADDPLLWDAARLVVKSQLGSTSGLQRRLKVGYARAGRIMDMLEAKGVVGAPDGSKPRDVLLDEAGLEDLIAAEGIYSEV